MKKYNYTESEQAAIVEARKGDRKELAKLVNKIRKQCIAENRFTEVEDTRSAKKADEPAKEKKQGRNAKGQFVSKKAAAEEEEESVVEVHGANESSVVIK